MEIRKAALGLTLSLGVLAPAFPVEAGIQAVNGINPDNTCELVLDAGKGADYIELNASGHTVAEVAKETEISITQALWAGARLDICVGNGVNDVKGTPQAVETTGAVATANACVYTVISGDNPSRIKTKTGQTVTAIATEMGVKESVITQLGKVVDICIGNGINDVKGTPNTTKPDTSMNSPVPTTDKTCGYSVISNKETANLLGVTGKSAKELCSMVVFFQKNNSLAADGIVGPATARKLIKQSENACKIYGGGKDDCFLGVQENGNLGTLYTIKDGDITRTMPARFGNPKRQGGKATPEGQFTIFRSIKGPHAGSNCPKVGGEVQTCMENPIYFNGGIAIHGTDKPRSAGGSLGCIGISNQNSDLTHADYKAGIDTVLMLDLQRNK